MLRSGGGAELLQQVKYDIVQYTRGRGVELGRGPFKAFPHFIGMRERSDTSMVDVAPDFPCDSFEDGLFQFQDGSVDFVFACGLDLISGSLNDQIQRVLKIDGYFVAASSAGAIEVWIKADGGYGRELGHPYLSPVIEVRADKTACVVRYGAIGDTLQATSILDELKREGYHVTWMCEPSGEELLRHDPRIDTFFLQDKDQVPNAELPAFWAAQAKRFDRFINLCESVEGTLIKLPGRADFTFPDAVRREMCDHNYMEFTAKLAELEFRPEYRFYASDEEREWAKNFHSNVFEASPNGQFEIKIHRAFRILWALSGSSTHKAYPHMDAVIARILTEIPQAKIILVGDNACQILEVGWENESRVVCQSGKLSIRETLALAQQCDLVIGPETGVLNAVAFESMPKVIFLSHSSEKNLTRDWVNTEALHGDVPCYPCHRLHYTDEFCPRDDDTRAALCAFAITPADVWLAVQRAFVGRETINRILLP